MMVLSNAPSSPRLTHRPISLDSASGDELTRDSASGERRNQNDGEFLLPRQDRGYKEVLVTRKWSKEILIRL